VYAVVSGEKPIYVLILAIFGFLGVAFLSIVYKKVELEIENKLDELEKED
jgi:cell division protein FtsL